MTLETAIVARIRAIHPKAIQSTESFQSAPDDLSFHLSRDADGRLTIAFAGSNYLEGADAAIPVIDALFCTNVEDTKGATTRLAYLHGSILRNQSGAPIGYQCLFEHEQLSSFEIQHSEIVEAA
jgi:hypothetical protein